MTEKTDRSQIGVRAAFEQGIAMAGLRIASASNDDTIRVYDAGSGNVVLRGDAGISIWGITCSPHWDRKR